VDSPCDRRVGRPTETLLGIDRQLDLDDDHPHGDVAVEKEDDDIGTVFGGLDLGQVRRGDAGLGIGRKRKAEPLDQDLGGERGTVLEQIHEDLMGQRRHAGDLLMGEKRGQIRSHLAVGDTWHDENGGEAQSWRLRSELPERLLPSLAGRSDVAKPDCKRCRARRLRQCPRRPTSSRFSVEDFLANLEKKFTFHREQEISQRRNRPRPASSLPRQEEGSGLSDPGVAANAKGSSQNNCPNPPRAQPRRGDRMEPGGVSPRYRVVLGNGRGRHSGRDTLSG